MEAIELPVKKIDGRYWNFLNGLDDKVLFRASRLGRNEQCRDPSDHRSMQVEGKGSPKCSPKNQNFKISGFR